MTNTRVLIALGFIAGLICAGCGSASDDPGLQDLLLTVTDLPAGFAAATPEAPQRIESDRPDCADTLQALEVEPNRDPKVREERAFFRNAELIAVQEVVRQYQSADRAVAEFTRITALLPGCTNFHVHFPNDGLKFAETVTPVSAVTTTNTSWAADVDVTTQGSTVSSRLILLHRGPLLAVVSIFTPFGAQPPLVDQALQAADRRLQST